MTTIVPPRHSSHGVHERSAFDLDAAPLVVVGACRAWVAPLVRPGQPHPDWRAVFDLVAMPLHAAAAFDTLMLILAHSAIRSIDVRCPRCPGLSPDEERLVGMLAALQAADARAATAALHSWLTAMDVGEALRAAASVAQAMADAGLLLAEQGRGSADPSQDREVLH